MKTNFEVFLDTDIYLEHLTGYGGGGTEESYLVKSLKLFNCYTSVLNASEIFAACSTKREREKALNSFYGTGVLGIPYKYSLKIGEILKFIKKKALIFLTGTR